MDEVNNIIVRFSNFKSSIPLKVDLTTLNEIKNINIFGILPPKIEEDVGSYIKEHLSIQKKSLYSQHIENHEHESKCMVIEDRDIDFSLNMSKYWE